jgi:hypothetical protein
MEQERFIFFYIRILFVIVLVISAAVIVIDIIELVKRLDYELRLPVGFASLITITNK